MHSIFRNMIHQLDVQGAHCGLFVMFFTKQSRLFHVPVKTDTPYLYPCSENIWIIKETIWNEKYWYKRS